LEALSKVESNGTYDPLPYMVKALQDKREIPVLTVADKARETAILEATQRGDFAAARRLARAEHG